MPNAARVGDMHTCPMVSPGPAPHVGGPITSGCSTVLIAGQPAARIGDMALCAGPSDSIVRGSNTVLIGGQPAARAGDNTAHGGVISVGCPNVIIGEIGGYGLEKLPRTMRGSAERAADVFHKASSANPNDSDSMSAFGLAAMLGATAGLALTSPMGAATGGLLGKKMLERDGSSSVSSVGGLTKKVWGGAKKAAGAIGDGIAGLFGS